MSSRMRAAGLLAGTLVIGVIIGLLVAAAMGQRRAERFEQLRMRGGFVEHMLTVIEPRDAEQRRAIEPHLRETALRNRQVLEGVRTDLAVELDSLRVRLAPLLDEEQMRRLERAGQLRDVFRGPGDPRSRRRGPRRPP